MFKRNEELEKYRSICEKYNDDPKDKQFILEYFIKEYKNIKPASLCHIGFDKNPLVIELILTNNDCIDVMDDDDAISQFKSYVLDFGEKITEKLRDKTIDCLSKNKKLLDKNLGVLFYIFRNNSSEYLIKLLDSGLDISVIFKTLNSFVLLSSNCFNIVFSHHQFESFFTPEQQNLIFTKIIMEEEFNNYCSDVWINNLIKLLDKMNSLILDVNTVYLVLFSSHKPYIKTILLKHVDTIKHINNANDKDIK